MCGFRHFAQAILGLGADQIPSLGPDPRDQGNAAHAALHHVYDDLKRAGGMAQARRDPQAAQQRAERLCTEKAEAILGEVAVHLMITGQHFAEVFRADRQHDRHADR